MHFREYPFHDGRLTSIAVADSSAVLGLRQAEGREFTMTLAGVEALNVDGFRLGNTILALRAVSGEGVPDGVLVCDQIVRQERCAACQVQFASVSACDIRDAVSDGTQRRCGRT